MIASPSPSCGTGIAARQFQAAGCRVLGVEPDGRMADFARSSGVPVEEATFEDWDPDGRRFDAVIAATSWHWIDPAAGAAKAAEVLRPGGHLSVFGHAFQLPTDVLDAVADVYQRIAPDAPINLQPLRDGALDAYQGMYARVADTIAEMGGFTTPRQWRFDWEQAYTRDEWLDQIPTHGFLTQLPPQKLAEVLHATGTAIDRLGGGFTMPYATVGLTAQRTPSI